MEEKYPVEYNVQYPERSSRLLALLFLLFLIPKAFLLIPHFIILWFLGMVSFFLAVIAQFAVLFTGQHPKALFDFIAGVQRWGIRVNAYFLGLTDKYPPFSLK